MKAAAGHHPIIQKEMDEVPANRVMESSSGGTWFLFQCVCCS